MMNTITKKPSLLQMFLSADYSIKFNKFKFKFFKKEKKVVNHSFLNFEVKDDIEEEINQYDESIFYNKFVNQ